MLCKVHWAQRSLLLYMICPASSAKGVFSSEKTLGERCDITDVCITCLSSTSGCTSQTALELESFQTASRPKIRTVRETRLQSAEKPTRHVSFADQHATDLLQELITAIQTLTTETRKRPRSPRRGNTRSDIICWECNQKGHRQRECPTLHQGSSRSRKRPLAELAGQSSAGISSAPKKIITKIIMKSPSMYLPQPVPSWYPHPILILTLHLHTPIILSYHPNHHLSHMIIPPL